jgi:hypothetical protein
MALEVGNAKTMLQDPSRAGFLAAGSLAGLTDFSHGMSSFTHPFD